MAFISYHDNSLILLVGRGGNGKTSCKRSIENVSNIIEVIECSGIGDTGSDRMENIKTVWDNLRMIMENYDLRGGFKAIAFALKYGVRFTKQEKDAVEDVKAMLGEDVFRNHGIILMSYGDLFELNKSEIGGDFMGWCREQIGDIKKLFNEVNYRIVLFNNRTDNFEMKREQFEALRSMVTCMGNPYRLNEFKAAQKLRQKPTGIMHSDNNRSSKLGSTFYTVYRSMVLLAIIGLLIFIALIISEKIQF